MGSSLVFLGLICGIGALIFVYASEYLRSHPRLGRFYAYLLLFTGSMAGLVLAGRRHSPLRAGSSRA